MSTGVVILAGGEGKRFQSTTPKVLHVLAGKPMMQHVIDAAVAIKPAVTVVVVSPGIHDQVSCALDDGVSCVIQPEAKGTGHAVMCAQAALQNTDYTLVLIGDSPLVRSDILQGFVENTIQSRGIGAVLTVEHDDPTGYGRIVRQGGGNLAGIVEHRDATPAQLEIAEINTGVFCCQTKWLFETLATLQPNNEQGELYLTDIVQLAIEDGKKFQALEFGEPEDYLGVNSREEFATAEDLMRARIVDYWMESGVSFRDPCTAYVDVNVRIGVDSVIEPAVMLRGNTVIGAHCHIETGSVITDSQLADHVHCKPYSVLESVTVGTQCEIGPFARLRPGTQLDAEVKIGNFVETKKAHLQRGAKASHLTYLGDTSIGERTNIGCGTITCNYDGVNKHRTEIGADVFVGSDTQFVAPVTIGDGATIAAGSVITENVPAAALALARSRQVLKLDWGKAHKLKKKVS